MRRPHVYERSVPRRKPPRPAQPEPAPLVDVVEVRVGGAVGYAAASTAVDPHGAPSIGGTAR